MKKKSSTIAFALLFIVGLSIMLYPSFSNFYNSLYCSQAITAYQEVIEYQIENAEELFEEAREYNSKIVEGASQFISGEPYNIDYINAFDIYNGMIGYLEIDEIDVSLPIYHGTAESELSRGVGHLEGSSLPTGDIGTHTVLSGHTGLPSADLLTDLDELEIGDTFTLLILDEVFTYEIVEINVVLPSDTSYLGVQADRDLVTLITCTPYGVNSHRLLVMGERIETPEEYYTEHVSNNTFVLFQLVIFIVVILFILLIVVIIKKKKRSKKQREFIQEEGSLNDEIST
ncbi:class C sortase [Tannockella kyphosi]|uniref:class C sortase n=1 Tax=Tannockella kyphosi TaxID=2899121 RepID=UPI0020115D52|nr:class C sortase [Tannockella kyphosi]